MSERTADVAISIRDGHMEARCLACGMSMRRGTAFPDQDSFTCASCMRHVMISASQESLDAMANEAGEIFLTTNEEQQ